MNYIKLFYWLVIADNARDMFISFTVIFTIIAIISTLCFIFGREDDGYLTCPNDGLAERSKKWIWFSYPFLILFWGLYIFTPSKKDALLIVAGGGTLNFLTTDSTAKKIPHEMSNFILTELKNIAVENQVELNIKDQKNKILEETKKMNSEELLQKMKSDSILKKIILDEVQ